MLLHSPVRGQQWKHLNNVWNLFKVNNDANDFILVSLLLILNRFHAFSGVSIVDFEQVNDGRDTGTSINTCSIFEKPRKCNYN